MFNFAGPIELELSLTATIIVCILALGFYSAVVLTLSVFAELILRTIGKQFMPSSRFTQNVNSVNGDTTLVKYLFVCIFVTAALTTTLMWDYFDSNLDPTSGPIVFGLINAGVSLITAVVLFSQRNLNKK